jgi:hypothetical protein
MGVLVSEICWCTDAEDFSFLFIDCFEDARVEYRGLSTGVYSYKENEVCIFNGLDLRVEEIVCAEVVRNVEGVSLPELIVETIECIKEIFHCLYIFN